jgi:hypothetical protein
MRVLFTIIIISASLTGYTQDGLGKLVKFPDAKALFQFQKKVDRFFASDWEFKSLVSVEIDHFKPGYILTWSRKFNGLLIERSYSFDLVSTLAYTHEQRFFK